MPAFSFAALATLDRGFRSRPLVFFLAAWVLGILAADRWTVSPELPGAVGLGLMALCLLFRRRWASLPLLLLGALLVGVAATRLAWEPPEGDISRWAGRRVTVWGQVADEPRLRCDVWRVVLHVESVAHGGQEVAAGGRLAVSTTQNLNDYRLGDRLCISGVVRLPSSARNPGGFSQELWLARQRIFATITARVVASDPLTGDWWPLARGAAHLRSRVAQANRAAIRDQQAAALVNSLLFGDLDQDEAHQWSEIEEQFRRAGVNHILVVSGAQVSFLFGLLLLWRQWTLGSHRWLPPGPGRYVRRLGGFSQRAALLVGIVVLTPFVLLAGAGISVLRAALMAAVFITARFADRESEPQNSLAAAGLLFLLHNPLSLYDVGGQLSFAAVWGILCLADPVARLIGFRDLESLEEGTGSDFVGRLVSNPAAAVVCVTIAAQLVTIPIIAQHFHRVALIGLLINLPVCLMAAFLLPLGLVTSLVSAVLIEIGDSALPLAQWVSFPSEQLGRFITWLVETSASLTWAYPPVFPPGWPIITVYIILLCFETAKLWHQQRWGLWVPIGLALGLMGVGTLMPSGGVRVPTLTFVDVGQGDACLLRLPGGETMLVDGGGSPRAPCRDGDCGDTGPGGLAEALRTDCLDVGRDILASFLRHERLSRIDLLVLSHPHDDHLWGLNAVLSPGAGFQVDAVLESGFPTDGPSYREWQSLLNRLGPKRLIARRGMQLTLGEATIDVLHPPGQHMRGTGSDENNNSVVLRLEVGGTRVLLPGDVEAAAEAVLRKQEVAADVLKIAHHGSATSSTGAWLDRVRPKIAVISCGVNNRFGHPSRTTEDALRQRNIGFYRTDQDGAVTLELVQGRWIARRTISAADHGPSPGKRGLVWNSVSSGKLATGGP